MAVKTFEGSTEQQDSFVQKDRKKNDAALATSTSRTSAVDDWTLWLEQVQKQLQARFTILATEKEQICYNCDENRHSS